MLTLGAEGSVIPFQPVSVVGHSKQVYEPLLSLPLLQLHMTSAGNVPAAGTPTRCTAITGIRLQPVHVVVALTVPNCYLSAHAAWTVSEMSAFLPVWHWVSSVYMPYTTHVTSVEAGRPCSSYRCQSYASQNDCPRFCSSSILCAVVGDQRHRMPVQLPMHQRLPFGWTRRLSGSPSKLRSGCSSSSAPAYS